MKKVIYDQYGTIQNLHMADVATPQVSADTLIIKIKSVSINPLDWKLVQGELKMMSGKTFPKGIGIDFSGVISEVGSNVSAYKVGDAVFGSLDAMKGPGALAEYIEVKPEQIHAKPNALSFEQAAALPIVGSAALKCIHDVLHVKSGDKILINGATGGVGMIMTQICQKIGANVTAVVSDQGVEIVKKWGIKNIVNYRQQSVTQLNERFDAVVDLSGKLSFAQARPLLNARGSYVNPTPMLKDILLTPLGNLFRAQKNKILMSNPTPQSLTELSDWANKGLDVIVGNTYAFENFAQAYSEMQKQGVLGKAVFIIE